MFPRPLIKRFPVARIETHGQSLGKMLSDAYPNRVQLIEVIGDIVSIPERGFLLARGEVGNPALFLCVMLVWAGTEDVRRP